MAIAGTLASFDATIARLDITWVYMSLKGIGLLQGHLLWLNSFDDYKCDDYIDSDYTDF
ncbi:MAG: hypothetical protein ACYDIA_11330 [Candidatus Humimicrobiaceae bacterium]